MTICPVCHATIHPDAVFCPKCQADTTTVGPSDADVDRALAEIGALPGPTVPIPREPSATGGAAPRKQGLRAPLLLASALLGAGVFILPMPWALLALTAALLAVGIWLYLAAADRPTVVPHGPRITPQDAAFAYYVAVIHGRWSDALAALSPLARARPAVRPPIDEIELRAGEERLDSPEALERYWAPFNRSGKNVQRSLTRVEVTWRTALADGAQALRVELVLSLTPTPWSVGGGLYSMAMRKLFRLEFDVVAVKSHGRYSLLSGDVCPQLDRRIIAMPARRAEWTAEPRPVNPAGRAPKHDAAPGAGP